MWNLYPRKPARVKGNTPNSLQLVEITLRRGLGDKGDSEFYRNLVKFYEKCPPLYLGGVFYCSNPEISIK